jgi:hypothetical protein
MTKLWHIGDLPRITATFTNDAGALVDPDTLVCKVKKPDGTVTSYVFGTAVELVRDSLGVYHIDIALTQAKNWFYRFEATGTRTVANEGTIIVQDSNFY